MRKLVSEIPEVKLLRTGIDSAGEDELDEEGERSMWIERKEQVEEREEYPKKRYPANKRKKRGTQEKKPKEHTPRKSLNPISRRKQNLERLEERLSTEKSIRHQQMTKGTANNARSNGPFLDQ